MHRSSIDTTLQPAMKLHSGRVDGDQDLMGVRLAAVTLADIVALFQKRLAAGGRRRGAR